MHWRTSAPLRLKEGNRSVVRTLTSPQSHTERSQFDREQKLGATHRHRTGRHIAERTTRNDNKPPNHKRNDRKLKRVSRG